MIWHPEMSIILTEIPEDCTVHAPVWIGPHVKIGHRCKIQALCYLPEGVTLEDDVFLGPAVICTNDFYPPSTRECWKPTLIKQGASIGANVTIVCGNTIGRNAMVGAGSVVTHDIPDNELWVGNPARKKGMRPG